MSANRRYRVLAIAEAANPEWVSVPLIGWALVDALRKVADVHLVTQVRNADAIRRTGLEEGADFTVIDSEAIARPAYRVGEVLRMDAGKAWTVATAVASLSYPYFERLVWQRFGREIQAGRWDIVHRVTPLSPTATSSIAAKVARSGVPFVLGPLNGGVPWPREFDAERRKEREWLSYVRGVYKLNPGRRRTLAASAAIITGSRFTQSEVPSDFQDRTIYLPENAVDLDRFPAAPTVDRSLGQGPLQACFVGRLVPYKGPDMVIEAAAPLLRSGRMRLDVIGDGPLRSELEQLVAREGLEQSVRLHGQVPHDQVHEILRDAHVMTFPSVREFGGGVVLEAMACGTVPIVVDYAGPGELVSHANAIPLPLGPRAEVVRSLRAVLDRLAADRGELLHKARAGRALVEEFYTWDQKARHVLQVYDWVTGATSTKPAPISQ